MGEERTIIEHMECPVLWMILIFLFATVLHIDDDPNHMVEPVTTKKIWMYPMIKK